jgi:hypothetical protein
MSPRITRNAIVAVLGTPDETHGSLNDPVEHEEHGISFNEKWVYRHLRDDPSGSPMRTIYWHRYDFTGTLVRDSADAEWRSDSSLIELSNSDGRLATVRADHEPQSGNPNYRPASEVRDAFDLGGYIEGKKP